MNFLEAINEAKRKALLTGQPLSKQEAKGMQAGWFDTASTSANARRAQILSEKQAQDRLEQERWTIEQQMEAAKKAGQNELVSNIGNNAVQTLGMDWIKSKPGESMISKGWEMGKEGLGTIGEATGLISAPGAASLGSAAAYGGQTFTGALADTALS